MSGRPAASAASAAPTTSGELDLGRGSVRVLAPDHPVARSAVEMILAEVRERYGREWTDEAAAPAALAGAAPEVRVTLSLDPSDGASGDAGASPSGGADGAGAADGLGPDGFRLLVRDGEVRIAAAAPRGLLYGAAAFLDDLQDAPLRLPHGERAEIPWATYRLSRVGSLYEPEPSLRRATFEARFRYLARHRFNAVVIAPDGFRDAIRYRYVPGLEGLGEDAAAAAAVEGTRALIRDARRWGFDVYLSLSEIDYPDALIQRYPHLRATPPPDAERTYSPPTAGGASTLYVRFGVKPNLCVSQPETWQFVEGKVREVAELFPEAAGITLAINGADSDVYFCHCPRCRELSKPQRAALMFRHVARGLEQGAPGGAGAAGAPGKRLIFSPYMGAWKNLLEPEVYGPLAGRLPPSVIMRLNVQYGDTYLFNSLNPLLGAYVREGTPELCEFDPGGEYHGGFFGLQPTISRWMAERIAAAAARGVRGFSFRNLQYRTELSELDWWVGAMLAWDPGRDVEALRAAWARRRFGAEAAPRVLALLDLGFEVVRRTLYADGLSFTNWGLFIESVDRTRHILIDRCAKLADRGLERIAPTPENIARLVAEKEAAFQLAEQGVLAADGLRGKVAPRYHQGLRTSFLVARELARVYKPELEALLRYFQWEATLSEVDRELLRRPILDAVARLRRAVEEARGHLAGVDARLLCEQLGMDWAAFKSNKGLYSQDPSVTAMDQNLALPYALELADDLEGRLQYVPASVFGYY